MACMNKTCQDYTEARLNIQSRLHENVVGDGLGIVSHDLCCRRGEIKADFEEEEVLAAHEKRALLQPPQK